MNGIFTSMNEECPINIEAEPKYMAKLQSNKKKKKKKRKNRSFCRNPICMIILINLQHLSHDFVCTWTSYDLLWSSFQILVSYSILLWLRYLRTSRSVPKNLSVSNFVAQLTNFPLSILMIFSTLFRSMIYDTDLPDLSRSILISLD